MTANVIPFGPRRKLRPAPSGCACEKDWVCYPHRCEAIGLGLEALLRDTQGELLVDRELVSAPVLAALDELNAIVTECFRPNDPPSRQTGGRR